MEFVCLFVFVFLFFVRWNMKRIQFKNLRYSDLSDYNFLFLVHFSLDDPNHIHERDLKVVFLWGDPNQDQ